MDLDRITLNESQHAELTGPFLPKHAHEAALLGFARALAENGISPSAMEDFLKTGKFDLGEAMANFPGQYALLGLGVGAVGGAYSGYARHRLEQKIEGKENPQMIALQKKIDSYRNLIADARRMQQVAPGSV
jgi:hypothetical protein